jgi:hypothetical protein
MKISGLALIPLLALVSVPAGWSAAPKKTPAAKETAKAAGRKILNCKDLQSIRDFKDIVIGTLVGTNETGRNTADEWAWGICGKAADKAGFNKVPPPNPSSVPASPGCANGETAETCAQRSADEYFGAYLPLSRPQALKLGRYIWRDLEPSAEKPKLK